MELYVLFGQRKESYEGEFGPEALICWDEYSVDENPEGFEEAVAEAKRIYVHEMSAMRVIRVKVDGDRITRLLKGTPSVEGTIVE